MMLSTDNEEIEIGHEEDHLLPPPPILKPLGPVVVEVKHVRKCVYYSFYHIIHPPIFLSFFLSFGHLLML